MIFIYYVTLPFVSLKGITLVYHLMMQEVTDVLKNSVLTVISRASVLPTPAHFKSVHLHHAHMISSRISLHNDTLVALSLDEAETRWLDNTSTNVQVWGGTARQSYESSRGV